MYVVPNQLEINNKFTDRSQKLLDSWTNKGQVDYSFHNDFWHIYFNFIANYIKQDICFEILAMNISRLYGCDTINHNISRM